MATYTSNEIINPAGILDNIHDFYLEDIIYNFYYLKCYREFYLTNTDISQNNFILQNKPLKFLIDKTLEFKNVNSSQNNKVKFPDYIEELIIKNLAQPKILLNDIQQKIIENFDKIFNVTDDYIETILLKKYQKNIMKHTNINKILNDDKKILLRQPLYFLIKTGDENLIEFFINYFGLNILSQNIISHIIKKIKENIIQFTKSDNILYPSTYFDDMALGITPDYKMRFKIINKDKHIIDQASVEGETSYLDTEYSNFYLSHFNFIDNKHSIGFSVQDEIDKIDFLNSKFYKKNNMIHCEFDGIILKVKENSVGRNSKKTNSYGLFQALVSLHKILVNTDTNIIATEKNKLDDIIDITDIDTILQTISNKYITTELCVGFIAFMLFGAKRYGDWIQVELAKKYYFMLQSNDHYLKLYAYLAGSPIIIDNFIYNYMPPNNFDKNIDSNIFQQFDTMGKYDNITDMKKPLIFTDIREIKTNEASRYYFDKYLKYDLKHLVSNPNSNTWFFKYLKYKNKYLKLKQLISNYKN